MKAILNLLCVIVLSLASLTSAAQTFINLHTFSATDIESINSDGAAPNGGLALAGDTLYGCTQNGGANGIGTVFAIKTNGTGFTDLYTFSPFVGGTNSDGAHPYSGMVLS
jgi:uncharacterized repeat protein (TIGR03803 family)